MIRVSVRALGPAEVVLGAREVRLEVPDASRVDELLERADELADGGLHAMLYTEDGRNEWVRILLNGRDVRFLPENAQCLKDGDVVHIMPTLGGG